ncbi:TFIIB zinc-binding [Fragilaria crotonensis]|nr:TFIIB zinc-binding [Fragilaria crotonensis]
MAALASALLFVEARKQGHARPLQEVCAAFEYPAGTNSGNTTTDDGDNQQNNNFIKPKHCSKAMKELRILFPEYTRATAGAVSSESSLTAASQEQGSDNFVEHATRKLELPPVATASIQILVEELQGKITETKMSTTCAAVTLLVCMAGAIMQRLARQAMDPSTMATKRLKTGDESNIKLGTRTESGVDVQFKKESTNEKIDSTQKFDTFLHPAASSVVDSVPSYEMRQMWDAWTEQMPWGRSLAALEQAFHISKPAVLEFFRTKIYPQRVELLSLLQESTKLRATPRATVLLSQMCSTASPLLNSQGKVV